MCVCVHSTTHLARIFPPIDLIAFYQPHRLPQTYINRSPSHCASGLHLISGQIINLNLHKWSHCAWWFAAADGTMVLCTEHKPTSVLQHPSSWPFLVTWHRIEQVCSSAFMNDVTPPHFLCASHLILAIRILATRIRKKAHQYTA